MSQSGRTLKEVGKLDIKKTLDLKLGSTSSVNIRIVPAPTSLGDADATLTVAQLKTGLFTITPTATRTLTLPTATLMSAFLKAIGESIEFQVINLGADTKHVVLAAGASGTAVGYMTVRDSDATAASDIGSGRFRIRMTAVDTPAYSVYRV